MEFQDITFQTPLHIRIMMIKKSAKPQSEKYLDSNIFSMDDFPEFYDETYIRALPRDPLWLYVYWELSSETKLWIKEQLGADFGNTRTILRLHLLPLLQGQKPIDFPIGSSAANWYIKVPTPGQKYVIEYGYMLPNDIFFSVTQTEPLPVPRDSATEPHINKSETESNGEIRPPHRPIPHLQEPMISPIIEPVATDLLLAASKERLQITIQPPKNSIPEIRKLKIQQAKVEMAKYRIGPSMR